MPFTRPWDSTCPRVWDQWEAEGTRFVIQDLRPEDDDLAVRMMVTTFINDEPLTTACGVSNDPVSLGSATELWTQMMGLRTSLACYADTDDGKVLAGVNCCYVSCQGEKPEVKKEGESWKTVIGALDYMSEKVDAFEHLEVDTLLYGLGLLVDKQFRKAKIGTRILKAREPFCRTYGIKGSSTVFTGVGSQTCAARAGFVTIAEATWKELADTGLNIPKDENRIIKLMVKKYN